MNAMLLRGRGGAAALEYALVLPALLLFLLGLMDTGRLLWTQATLDHGVEIAARCGSVNATDCKTVEQIQAYAADQSQPLSGIASSNFTVCNTKDCGGVCVSASYMFYFIIPWNVATKSVTGPGSLSLKSKSCYPL